LAAIEIKILSERVTYSFGIRILRHEDLIKFEHKGNICAASLLPFLFQHPTTGTLDLTVRTEQGAIEMNKTWM